MAALIIKLHKIDANKQTVCLVYKSHTLFAKLHHSKICWIIQFALSLIPVCIKSNFSL